MAEGRREDVVELFFRELLGSSDDEVAWFRSQPSWKIRVDCAHTLAREDRAERSYRFAEARWRSFETPTLLVVGSESPPSLRRSSDALAAALPNGTMSVLEGQAHFAMATAPGLLAQTIADFL